MTLKELVAEIAAKVEWLQEHNGATIHKQWLITAVLADHDRIQGDDRDFALCCARYAIEQQVDRYFRSIKQNEEDQTEQQLLPGFERLQKRYICERNDEQMIVMVEDMTDAELDLKASQHRQMGDGHYKHADELIRFKEERRHPQPTFSIG